MDGTGVFVKLPILEGEIKQTPATNVWIAGGIFPDLRRILNRERPQEVLQNMEVSHATMTPTQWALKGLGELPHFKNLRLSMEGVGWICWT